MSIILKSLHHKQSGRRRWLRDFAFRKLGKSALNQGYRSSGQDSEAEGRCDTTRRASRMSRLHRVWDRLELPMSLISEFLMVQHR